MASWRLRNALSASCFTWKRWFESNYRNEGLLFFCFVFFSQETCVWWSSNCQWSALLGRLISSVQLRKYSIIGIIKDIAVFTMRVLFFFWGGGLKLPGMKQSPYISAREIQSKSGSTQSCCATPLIPENDVIMLKVSATPPYPFHLHYLAHTSLQELLWEWSVFSRGMVFAQMVMVHCWQSRRGWCQPQWKLDSCWCPQIMLGWHNCPTTGFSQLLLAIKLYSPYCRPQTLISSCHPVHYLPSP